jgi:[ribosomal protein S18]-alanine N-acetyltransferase
VRLRPLSPLDAAALATIHTACFRRAWNEASFAGFLRGAAHGVAAEATEGKLTGFLLWQSAGEEADILTFAVYPADQQHGVGTALLQAAKTVWKAKGIHTIFLETAVHNHAALRLYARGGFERIGTRRGYYVEEGCDAVLMRYRCSGYL